MKKKNVFIALFAILIVIVLGITMYSIDMNRMKNNKPVIFSNWGYSYVPPIDIAPDKIEKLEDSVNVTFEIESLGETLLSLTLNVADVLQAEQLKDGFLDDPGALYSDIIDRLIGDK